MSLACTLHKNKFCLDCYIRMAERFEGLERDLAALRTRESQLVALLERCRYVVNLQGAWPTLLADIDTALAGRGEGER